MRLYVEGEKSSGVCEACKRKVATTFARRDYRPEGEGWDAPVPGVLVATCDECGEVVAIPHQSTARLNAYRRQPRPATKVFTVRVSGELEEVLDLIVSRLGGPNQAVQPNLLRYYLTRAGDSPAVAALLKDRATTFPAATSGGRQIAVRLRIAQLDGARRVAREVGVRVGDLLRGAVALAAEDGGITYRDDRGRVVSSAPDAAGLRRFADMKVMAETLA